MVRQLNAIPVMRGSRRATPRFALHAALLVLVVVLPACARVAVETEGRADARFETYATFHALPLVVLEEAVPSDSGIREALDAQLTPLLEGRGYAAAGEGEARLDLHLTADRQLVLRQTWSSDPDANSYVQREFDEAVLTLRAVDTRGAIEIWRGEARGRLPAPDLLIGPSHETIWLNLLAELVASVPER